RVPYPDLAGIVLQIGDRSAGAEIAPLADHRVTEVAVVSFIGIAEDHDILELASNDRPGAERGCTVYLRSHFNDSTFAGCEWAPDQRAFHDLGVAGDIDRTR